MAWIMSVSQSHAFTPQVWRNRISAGLAKSGKSSRSSSILMIRPLTLDAHDCTSMRLGQEDQNLAVSGRRARSGAHVTFGGLLWAHRASSPHPAKALLNRLSVHGLRPVPPRAIGEQSTAPVRSAARCLIAPKLEFPLPGIVTQAWISSGKPWLIVSILFAQKSPALIKHLFFGSFLGALVLWAYKAQRSWTVWQQAPAPKS